MNKIDRVFIFVLSPLVSFPFVLNGIYNKSKASLTLFAILLGIVSYLYQPLLTNDKAYYYYMYDTLGGYDLSSFWRFIQTEKTDFLFYGLIYAFSLLKIPLNILFFILTFITVKIWLYLFFKSFGKEGYIEKKMFFFLFLILVCSFSLPSLLSGVRFYLAVSFCLLGFSKYIFNESKYAGVFFILLGSITHFSCIVYLPVYIFMCFRGNRNKLVNIIFYSSFVFVLVPVAMDISSLVGGMNLSLTYQDKVQGYLGGEDFIEASKEVGNWNNYMLKTLYDIWIYIAYAYVLLVKNNSSRIKNTFLITLAVCNVFYYAPTVYNRYLILSLGAFIFMVIHDYMSAKKTFKFIYVILITLSANFLANVYSLRANLSKSLFSMHSLTSPGLIIKKDVSYNELK